MLSVGADLPDEERGNRISMQISKLTMLKLPTDEFKYYPYVYILRSFGDTKFKETINSLPRNILYTRIKT